MHAPDCKDVDCLACRPEAEAQAALDAMFPPDEDYHCDLFTCDCGFQCDDPEVMDAHENHGAGCDLE